MSKTISELRTELGELKNETRELLARDRNTLTAEDAERVSVLEPEIRRVQGEIEAIEGRMDALKGMHSESGTPFVTSERKPVTQRDRAMRSIEAMHTESRTTAEGAEAIEKLFSTGAPTERSFAQRWAISAGSPAYERAFAKLLSDPERGHMLFTGEEAEAFRDVVSLQSEQRAMAIGSGSTGGYMVPTVLDPAVLLTNNSNNNPLRQISRVVQTVGSQWSGVTSAGSSAEWKAEATEVADASPTLAQPNIPVHFGDAFVPFSFEAEGDAVDLVGQLGAVLADAADNLTATAYTIGSGSGQPTGVVTALAAASPSVIVSGSGEALASSQFYALQNALGPRFQGNARWTMNLSTLNALRQMETTNGALQFPELRQNPPQLLGRRVHENSVMDGTINAAATENNYAAIYGDFSNFVIVDRIGSTVEIVQHMVGTNHRPTGQRGLLLWFRTGSDVVISNAFRMLNIATTA